MTAINGQTQIYGLIGGSVAHSLSPLLHNRFASEYGINFAYLSFPVAGNLENAVNGAFALGICGLNITTPYKTWVTDYICEADETVTVSCSCNTLLRTKKGYRGYNTDIAGVELALRHLGVNEGSRRIAVIGAGGAAVSAALGAAVLKPKELFIANRTYDKAKSLASRIRDSAGIFCEPVFFNELNGLGEIDAVIQGSSAGFGDEEASPVSDFSFLKRTRLALDMIYYPEKTRFLREAENSGASTANGLGCLIYQAAASFEIWNGIAVQDEIIDRILNSIL